MWKHVEALAQLHGALWGRQDLFDDEIADGETGHPFLPWGYGYLDRLLMREEIRTRKGDLQVKAAPRAVDERDDKLLANLMTTLEAQNEEVDGDADQEEEEGMGSADVS